MLRGAGVTPAAKRTQEACRPRDRASKEICRGADVVQNAEGTIACIAVAGCRGSAGVEERGMQARVAQEPGRPRRLQPTRAGRAAATRTARVPGACLYPGSERGKAWYRRAKETKQGGTDRGVGVR